MVDIYRNGVFKRSAQNDGRATGARWLRGRDEGTFKVCEAGTTKCSNIAAVTYR
jgi:hypothetical protein